MTYDVYLTHTFKKCLKILKKKYGNIKTDIIGVIRELESDSTVGDPVPGWNREIWKVRVAVASNEIDRLLKKLSDELEAF